MSVTATIVLAEDAGPRERPDPVRHIFVESLVVRLHAEYGGDQRAIRLLALEALASFAGARVQAFVPILVEKRLRQTFRALD